MFVFIICFQILCNLNIAKRLPLQGRSNRNDVIWLKAAGYQHFCLSRDLTPSTSSPAGLKTLRMRNSARDLGGWDKFNPPAVITPYSKAKNISNPEERINGQNVRDGQLSATLCLRLDFPRDFRSLSIHCSVLSIYKRIGNTQTSTWEPDGLRSFWCAESDNLLDLNVL